MAKHCDVCDQDYADNLTACPHCAAGKKTQLAGRGEERKTQLAAQSDERTTQLAGPGKEPAGPPQPEATPADSAVNLGGAPVEVAAGDSGVLLEEVASNSGVNLAEAAVVDVAKPEPPEPSASDIALESLMAEPPTGEVIA